MIIDKSIGGSWEVNFLDEIDNIAYYLYVKNRIKEYPSLNSVTQSFFVNSIKLNHSVYQKYYDRATIFLRRNKIEKILSHGNR